MVAVPPATPVTIPDKTPTVAMAVRLLLQVPPVEASFNVTVDPAHITVVPVTANGTAFTVTVLVAEQPSETE